MQSKKLEGGFLLRLEAGEELVESLCNFMRKEQIGCGAVTGLGAVDHARLGFYQVAKQNYLERTFEGEFEVVGLTGTMSWHDGEPFPHIHLMLTDEHFAAFGGHCFAARASATVELFVRAYAERVERHIDLQIGLHLMDLVGGLGS